MAKEDDVACDGPIGQEGKEQEERNVSWGALSSDDAGISPADIRGQHRRLQTSTLRH